jgi:hypothetical protein
MIPPKKLFLLILSRKERGIKWKIVLFILSINHADATNTALNP